MDQQPLAEQEQPGELARLEDRAFPVLAGHDEPNLKRRPPTVSPLTECLVENELLPGIEVQAGHPCQIDGFTSRGRPGRRNSADPRPLLACQVAWRDGR
jgi:hypothetical protein